jgi:hypothetical protein
VTQQESPGDAVTVAYVHSNEVAYSWHHSMTELIGYDMTRHARVIRGGYIAMRCGAAGLVAARNKTITEFLSGRDAQWLLWIDTDMGFPADAAEKLLEAADPAERPIVGGLCFSQTETDGDGMGGWRCSPTPTIFDWKRLASGQEGFAARFGYPVNTLTRCAGTGSALILIHRSVFTRIAAQHGPCWYDMAPNPTTGQLIGEDLSFCARAGALGIPLYVHTGVRSSHLKRVWLAEPDHWQALYAAPAAAETAVVVPVMGRPQHAAPFMASLRASTGMARCYAVAHSDDAEAIGAWRDAGADVITGDVTTFAQKVNLAAGKTAEPWLFVTGSDVVFHPGWLDHAQATAGDRWHVIGTNDLGNPRVTAGEHATHLLIRRSYIDEHGASWDGPGVVCHEGYGHMFVDDEIVAAARQRGVFAAALGSRVEHLHPAWQKADMDEVYQLGLSHWADDKTLFEKRSAANS